MEIGYMSHSHEIYKQTLTLYDASDDAPELGLNKTDLLKASVLCLN